MAAQMETARASMRPAEDLSRLERMRDFLCRNCWWEWEVMVADGYGGGWWLWLLDGLTSFHGLTDG